MDSHPLFPPTQRAWGWWTGGGNLLVLRHRSTMYDELESYNEFVLLVWGSLMLTPGTQYHASPSNVTEAIIIKW